MPEILPFLVAVGGLVVAGLSLFLTYRERTASYRLRLYDKQVDAQKELMAVLAPLQHIVFEALMHTWPMPTRGYIFGQVGPQWNDLQQLSDQWSFVLPEGVLTALQQYGDELWRIWEPPNSSREKEEAPRTEVGPLLKAYGSAVAVMREAVGTAALQGQTARLLGQPRTPERPF